MCREKVEVAAKICPHCRENLASNSEWIENRRDVNRAGPFAGLIVIALLGFLFVDFDCSPNPPSPKPVSQAVLAEREAQREAGRVYAFEMTSHFKNAGIPKDWALEEIAKNHQDGRAKIGYEPYWREGFKSGYREGINAVTP